MRPELEQVVVYGVLALMCGLSAVCSVFALIAGRALLGVTRKIHLQQANIVAMLLRAGFRPARGKPDWFEDGEATQLPGSSYTEFDFSKPHREEHS